MSSAHPGSHGHKGSISFMSEHGYTADHAPHLPDASGIDGSPVDAAVRPGRVDAPAGARIH